MLETLLATVLLSLSGVRMKDQGRKQVLWNGMGFRLEGIGFEDSGTLVLLAVPSTCITIAA